jgi:hypothetical protein
VLKEAEHLAEKNVELFKKHLDEVEDRLIDLDAENQKLSNELKLKSQETTAAKYNACAIVDSVRFVLEEALRHPQNWHRVQCQNMRQLLQDYPVDCAQPVVETVRLPQHVYRQLVTDLRDSQDTISAMRDVASEQAQLIKEQSARLSESINRYEHVGQALQTRSHEVLLLDGRNKELEEAVADYEHALQLAEQDRERIQTLQDQVNDTTRHYEARINEKDSALLKMRQKLDLAQEQLVTAHGEIRKARAAQAFTASEASSNKPRPSLTSSYSSFAISTRQVLEQSEPSRPQQTYRILGPRSDLLASLQPDVVVGRSPSVALSLAQPLHARRLSDPFQDPPSITRNCAASLDSEKILTSRPNDRSKPLPSPPAVFPTIPATATLGQAGTAGDVDLPAGAVPRPSPQFHMRDPHGLETPANGKRMLSIIAEASQEGSSSLKSVSATSSEKNEYRNSISALELLNSQSSPASKDAESPVMHASWAEVHRRHDMRKAASPDLNVSKLYHQDRQHL